MFAKDCLTKWAACFGLGIALAVPLVAQQQSDRDQAGRDQARSSYRAPETSDLAQENLNRVAASAAQIRAVLAKEQGLMVELKRWVAKEATDNGQVVDDANLTDQAIFDRLEQDVVFRSVATRLLQHYGYLLPTSNPDSDIAKEKELMLKERARRLVQIESQEDTESLRPQGNNRDFEQAACDPRQDEDCTQPDTAQRRQRSRAPVDISSPQTTPPAVPEQLPRQNLPRIMQADGMPQSPDLREGPDSAAGYQLASNPATRTTNPLDGSQSLGGAIDGL